MAKIFILEDSDERIQWFRKEFSEHQLFFAIDAEGGKQAINSQKYSLIFLDHDLGGRVYVDSNESNTGFQVAKEIQTSVNKNTYVVVHSLNTVGAANILGIISHAIRLPFGTFTKETFKFHDTHKT